jgi:hypothetical protein
MMLFTLIEIEDILLRDTMSANRVHNTKFRFRVKPADFLLILQTAKVEGRPGQLANTNLGHIFRIPAPADNRHFFLPCQTLLLL